MAQMTLKAARVNAGLSQKAAAKVLEISNKTLCSWENGKTAPNVQQVETICKVYNVTYNDLIFLPSVPLKADC